VLDHFLFLGNYEKCSEIVLIKYFMDFLYTSCCKIYKFSTGFGKNNVLEVERWLDPAFYWK
jgi:hypothetical protein